MDWTNLITCLAGVFLGTGGSVLFYKPQRKEADTKAEKAHDDYVEQRLNSVERLYKEQGELLDDMRRQMLEMSKIQIAKDQKILNLESDNEKMKAKIDKLEKELEAYKVIAKK